MPLSRSRLRAITGLGILLSCGAAGRADPPAWLAPARPFRIVGPIYYVGSEGLAAYLFASSNGLILLDGTLERNVPMIERNIAALGFKLGDVKILLNSHAHFDHAGGLARLKRDTGARLLASAGDRRALEAGRPRGETVYGVVTFPPVQVDGELVDGRTVRLGDLALTPILTPGHTPGCTTFTLAVQQHGRRLRVVFPCSITVAGNKLTGNREYPSIVADFRRTFDKLRTLRADVVLTAHPDIVDVEGREKRQTDGERDAFVMPGMLSRIVAKAELDFGTELTRQQGGASEPVGVN